MEEKTLTFALGLAVGAIAGFVVAKAVPGLTAQAQAAQPTPTTTYVPTYIYVPSGYTSTWYHSSHHGHH